MDGDGRIFLLEINPNCGILYPPGMHGTADFILTLDDAHGHMTFIDAIIETALLRHRRWVSAFACIGCPPGG